jgi:hypothetical protein
VSVPYEWRCEKSGLTLHPGYWPVGRYSAAAIFAACSS